MKAISRSIFFLLLLGGIPAVVINQNNIKRLRAERGELLDESAESRRLNEENQGMPGLLAQNAEVLRLKAANWELPKLRNDVRQLRREAEEAQKLRAANEHLVALLHDGPKSLVRPAGFISKSNMVDAGLGSPEAAVQTFFCAFFHGDEQRLLQCSYYANEATKFSQSPNELAAQMNRSDGFAITATNLVADGEIVLTLQFSVDGPQLPIRLVHFLDGAWKIEH